jgi:predicted amidohydrolase YtcJ
MRLPRSGKSQMPLPCQRLACNSVLATLLALVVATLHAEPASADRIFVNGRIWTGEVVSPAAEALAVKGDQIVAIGSNAEVRRFAGPATAIVDLKGRRVVPGFHDSHIHFPGPPIHYLQLNGSESPAEVQRRLAQFARAEPNRPWLTGEGWSYDMFPGLKPHRRLLDAVVADRPVYIWDRDGHAALANSKALELGGITRATPDPPNGRIARDDDGEPTGLLHEAAMRLMDAYVPGTTVEENYEALIRHMDEAAATGLTAVQNAWWAASEQSAFLRAAASQAPVSLCRTDAHEGRFLALIRRPGGSFVERGSRTAPRAA